MRFFSVENRLFAQKNVFNVDVSGVFSTVSALALGAVQPVSTSEVTLTTHCAFVETPNPYHTS